MKKNILLIPVLATLMCGCTVDDLMFWKQKEAEQSQNEEKSSGNTGQNENQGQQNQPQELGHNDYTVSLQTSGSGFVAKFPAGSHFDTSAKQESLKGYLESQLQYANLIKSVACTNLHSQAWYNETYLQFGSGSGSGALAFQSDVKIYKVSVKVLCYAKYDSYHQITNIDSWSHFLINDQDNDMTYDGQSNPSVMSFENTFESGVNTFTLASKDGRVFLKEVSITWRG